MDSLKIRSHIKPILDLIRHNALTTVIAPTGTGKSIGIPWGVAETKSRIFVSVPTIVSAISLAEALKKYAPSLKVGYAAEGKINYDSSSQVVYATSGHLRLKILRSIEKEDNEVVCNLSFTDVLMIDEYHLHKADNDVIYGIWNFCLKKGQQVPRMVLVSATPDADLKDISARYVVNVESYPITIQYINSKRIQDDIIAYAKKLNSSSTPGHILIFLSGSKEVNQVARALRNLPRSLVFSAYSEMPKNFIDNIYRQVPKGVRKIIVTTNVLETSVTIPDVGIVIDSMEEKEAQTSPVGGLKLVTTNISKNSAIQRCGRTGRTMAGQCYRMMSEYNYNNLQDEKQKEIERIPLHRHVMELITKGLNPAQILPTEVEFEIEKSIALLYQLNLVDRTTNTITAGGIFVFDLPLGVRTGTVLYNWVIENPTIIYPGLVVTTLIDNWGPSYFRYPRQNYESKMVYAQNIKKFKEEMIPFQSENGSIGMIIKMWNAVMNYKAPDDLDTNMIYEWSQANNVNFFKLRDGMYRIKQIMVILRNKGYMIEEGPFTEEGLSNKLLPIINDIYSDMVMTLKSKREVVIYYHSGTRRNYTLDIREQYLAPGRINAIITTDITNKQQRTNSFVSFYSVIKTGRKKEEVVLTKEQEDMLAQALALF